MGISEKVLHLLAVETEGIQAYIFGSNRLKENIGASYLVKLATEDWAFDVLRDVAPRNNLGPENTLEESSHFEDEGLDAEVLYAGGGNIVILFAELQAAKAFTWHLSARTLRDAPGLRLNIYHEPYKWESSSEGLGQAVKRLLQGMKRTRNVRRGSVALSGIGVTAMCQSTAMPAVDDSEGLASAEVLAKREASIKANEWLRNTLLAGRANATSYTFPYDLDELGRSEGERSYMAVVHADGNGMGKRIREIGDIRDNRTYITQLRQFSERVKAISEQAMDAVVSLLIQAVREGPTIPGRGTVPGLKLWPDHSKKMVLPVRPIVFGGDDTTFVCDGRLGLSLATAYLRAFENAALAQQLRLSACAGVAIVKVRYPFARAYQLSESLCDSAKTYRRDDFPDGGSALDWHFTSGGLYDTLKAMRNREYTVSSGALTLRPVSLGPEGEHRSWSEIERLTQVFQEVWAERRNKVKALRDVLREGPHSVERFQRVYLAGGEDGVYGLPPFEPFTDLGWHDGVCGYFDALELADIHIPLQEKLA
ncbi:MAG: hypothetical protein IT323_20460 [Anaerolineae bacterium]|nr:hypothetical protein [Anaerolineae bacterium]